MSWTITVDPDLCIGSGMCAGAHPETFRLEGEHAEAPAGPVEPEEGLLDVADSCPAQAILIHDAAGTEVGPRP